VQEIVNAIIYLPSHVKVDSAFAQQCLLHIERRGYQLSSIVHEWKAALRLTRTGAASVIVFARPEHFDPDFEPRIEFVGETTQDLTRYGVTRDHRPRNERGDSRGRRPRPTN
jgi:hypothetical protein